MMGEKEARGSGGAIDPIAFLRALRRRMIFIVLIVVLVVGATGAYVFSVAPVYTAATKIIIDANSRQPFDGPNAPSRFGSDALAIDSQLAVISSASVLRPVVEAQKLVEDPEFGDGAKSGLFSILVGHLFPAKEISGSANEAERTIKTMNALAKALSVDRQGATYVIDIGVKSQNPVKAAALSLAIANGYLAEQQREARERAERLAEQIDDRLIGLREKLRATEEKVQEYRAKFRLQSSSDGTLLIGQELDGLNAQLAEARSALATARASNQEIQRYLKREIDPTALGDLVSSPRVTKLLEDYAAAVRLEASLAADLLPSHPTLIRAKAQVARISELIRQEIKAIGEAKKIELDVAAERVANLERQIDGLRSNSDADEQQLITLRELETEAKATRAVYENVLSRAKEVANLDQVTAPLARIISPAVPPEKPSWPKRKILLVLAVVVGTMLGTTLVVAGEAWRQISSGVFSGRADRARPVIAADSMPHPTPHLPASSDSLPFPLIGELPVIDPLKPRHVAELDLQASARLVYRILAADKDNNLPAPAVNYENAVMDVLAGVLSDRGDEETRAVLMTAPDRGDGLSLTAFSLAVAGAASGLKVLLIDANAKDKDLTRLLDNGSGHVGGPFSERIISNRLFDLSFLSLVAGVPKHRPLEIALDDRQALEEIANGYDLVLVDAGALANAVSLTALAGFGDLVLLAVRRTDDFGERVAARKAALLDFAGGSPVLVAATMAG